MREIPHVIDGAAGRFDDVFSSDADDVQARVLLAPEAAFDPAAARSGRRDP